MAEHEATDHALLDYRAFGFAFLSIEYDGKREHGDYKEEEREGIEERRFYGFHLITPQIHLRYGGLN